MTPEALRAFRIAHECSQSAIAHVLGVTVNTVHNWETGKTTPPNFLYPALYSLFGLFTRETLEGDPIPPPELSAGKALGHALATHTPETLYPDPKTP